MFALRDKTSTRPVQGLSCDEAGLHLGDCALVAVSDSALAATASARSRRSIARYRTAMASRSISPTVYPRSAASPS